MSDEKRKVLIIGIDGMDPRLTRTNVDNGRMPATKKLLEMGSARHDLAMIGGHPGITPPMWTTLATGAYACTHGITDYFRASEKGPQYKGYNFDSAYCRAEQLWNVTAESGMKTLVFNWPGSSWPPSSPSPNLHVIDGTQPAVVNAGVAHVEDEFILQASVLTENVTFKQKAAGDENIPCVEKDLKITEFDSGSLDYMMSLATLNNAAALMEMGLIHVTDADALDIPLTWEEGCSIVSDTPYDIVLSPLKEPHGWVNAPEDAKEFTLLLSHGYIRRPSLLLKNEDGKYDRVAIYKSKKETAPLVTLEKDVYTKNIIDEGIKGEKRVTCNRNMRLLEVAEDGSKLRLWVSSAMELGVDMLMHPKSLYNTMVEKAGLLPPHSLIGSGSYELITKCLMETWETDLQWSADAIRGLIEANNYQAVFTQVHNCDAMGHMILRYVKERSNSRMPEETYQELMNLVYEQTDRYIARYLDMVDDGWDIMVVSDHAQIAAEYEPYYFSGKGIMNELGYAVLKTDENGKEIREYDWSKTKAIASRSNCIHINLKGRDPEGIVDPEDKWELEEQIITDLYSYKDKGTGKRIISMALRRKDAVVIGLGGEEDDTQTDDIIYLVAEGYNHDHGDTLTTSFGYAGTAVAPIFIAAGPHIKENFTTKRYIRQVDVTPTMAVLLGVRMPNECEGAPIYQILK